MFTLFKVLFCIVILTALFMGGLFVWEFLVRFVWRDPSLSLLFNRDEW